MTEELNSLLSGNDCMATYEYIVNNVDSCHDDMEPIVEHLKRIDLTGQFLSSTARFLAAVDREHFNEWITILVEGAIDKDREHRYIPSLLESIWGRDYMEHVDELRASDDVFRRLYKRVYPAGVI
ncbi:MAG: hypothetical protein K2M03_02965 [Muribaculaceae bacterium]|nr:hypothetical protein [Muribaculaceae bacterium]